MPELVSYTVHGGDVAVLTVQNPPVNALSPGVPEGAHEGLRRALADGAVRAVVLIGGGRTFIAGADINQFGKRTSGETEREDAIHPLIRALEASAKPVVAAIHGTAFGGGLEVALACHYRVAVSSAMVGQPEVKLGLIPGAGGTQRLPRLAGVAKAVEMCAFGDPSDAGQALNCGLVDHIAPGDGYSNLLAGAVEFAREKADAGGPHPVTSRLDDKLGDAESNAKIFAAARAVAAKKFRGHAAPLRAIEAVDLATHLPFQEGLRREAEIFRECLFSDQSKAMIHAFFGERTVRRIPDVPKQTAAREINAAAVIGAGTMGGGIAMAYANVGIPVLLKDTTQEALDRGLATIHRNYARSVKRGRLSQVAAEERMGLIHPTLDYDDFEDADIIVEAVFEGMELKKKIFGEIDFIARPGAVLATNTSTLSIDEIAAATSRPQDVIGHHFFSPANVMRLLEIVRGKETSKEVIATSMALAKRLKKVGVLVGNCPGFVGNRMFGPYRREAQFLVEDGAKIADVDRVLEEFGMAMGPLAVGDLAGLDVGWRIRKESKHLEPEGARQPVAEDRLCELGHFGQKTGAGWYRYGPDRSREVNPEAEALVAKLAAEHGIEQREIDVQEIADRCIFALVNEGARILEEGYALRSVDIDVIYLNGYGFPPYRGGPMWHADAVGLRKVLKRIRELEAQHGHWWKPAPLLVELAESHKSFAKWDLARAAKQTS